MAQIAKPKPILKGSIGTDGYIALSGQLKNAPIFKKLYNMVDPYVLLVPHDAKGHAKAFVIESTIIKDFTKPDSGSAFVQIDVLATAKCVIKLKGQGYDRMDVQAALNAEPLLDDTYTPSTHHWYGAI